MDDISRDPQPDTTTRSPGETPLATERGVGKGPEEFLLAERNELQEDLVVGRPRALTRRDPTDEPPPAWVLENRLLRQRMTEAAQPTDHAELLPTPAEAHEEAQTASAETLPEPPMAEEVSLPPDDLAAPALFSTDAREGPDDLAGPESVAAVAEQWSGIDAGAAAAAVAEEAEVVEIEEELAYDEELPPVPELRDIPALARTVFVLMLTSREGLTLFRLAQACNSTQKLVEQALVHLHEQLQAMGLPIELARNGDTVKWMSNAEMFPYLQRLRGVKKLEKLSPAALETLAVIAYRQPVMRSEIEAIRGVKAGPMLRTLLQHKLVQTKGRAEVPGRPLQYGTTPQFLERFGLASLAELPSIKEWKNLG